MNIQTTKTKAKQSSVGFPTTGFTSVAPSRTSEPEETENAPDLDSALTSRAGEACSIVESVPSAKGSKVQVRSTRPLGARNVSLDNIAENIEGLRRSPAAKASKENVPIGTTSLRKGTHLPLRNATTPVKRGYISTFKTPPATALWTRMISSPPTPLSPVNRPRSVQSVVGVSKCASVNQTLELACAKARASERPGGEETAIAGGGGDGPNQTTLPRPRKVSAQKRLREEIEKDTPRKRTAATELHQKALLEESQCPTWRVASWRSSCAAVRTSDTSGNEEDVTLDDSTLPSSPSSVAVDDVSAKLVSSQTGQANVSKADEGVLDLSELEANAAFILASLFTV